MTQDRQARRRALAMSTERQVVADDGTEDSTNEQSGAMTRFQKVASALRGDRPDQPDDADAGSEVAQDQGAQGQTAMSGPGPA